MHIFSGGKLKWNQLNFAWIAKEGIVCKRQKINNKTTIFRFIDVNQMIWHPLHKNIFVFSIFIQLFIFLVACEYFQCNVFKKIGNSSSLKKAFINCVLKTVWFIIYLTEFWEKLIEAHFNMMWMFFHFNHCWRKSNDNTFFRFGRKKTTLNAFENCFFFFYV